jgi:uncharacterized membrane protein
VTASPPLSSDTLAIDRASDRDGRRASATLLAGAFVWAVHLGAIYLIEAFLIQAGSGDRRTIGLARDEVLVLAVTIGCAVVTAAFVVIEALRALRRDDEPDRFLAWLSCLLNVLFTIAIVAEGLVVLFLPGSH